MVTVRPSGWRSSCVLTAMPPSSACRRSSWISCGRVPGQHKPWPPRFKRQTPTGLHREMAAGHQGAESSRKPQGPHRASEMDPTHHNWGPRPRDCHAGVCSQTGVPTHAVLLAPITAHSPGTCVVRPGSSCEEQLSSGPALHPSLPACSWVTRSRKAPAEGRGRSS